MLPDSPIILAIEATVTCKSQYRRKTYKGPDCGGKMSGDIEICELDGEMLCEPCFIDRVFCMSADELARRMGCAKYTADEAIKRGQ